MSILVLALAVFLLLVGTYVWAIKHWDKNSAHYRMRMDLLTLTLEYKSKFLSTLTWAAYDFLDDFLTVPMLIYLTMVE
jgi:hypothetical protein